jgi:hypothetical protein
MSTRAARWVIALTALAALMSGGLELLRTGTYGLSLFVVAPLLIGAFGAWVVRPATARGAAVAGALATLLATFFPLAVGYEGLLCISMALPLALPLGAVGGWIFYRSAFSIGQTQGLVMMLFLPSASLVWDVSARPEVFEVHSAVEIAAPPERVWKHVVTFSDLPEPDEWYFRAGLAYPQRARIMGSGPGAVRYCEFSTGPFVEPIQVWNEPRLLRFNVTENPEPMHEWSPYANVLPKHLHGYLVSKRGQFRLTELANHHTLLEGTTWYQHGLWPAEYWRWWSDAMIHRIHLRVLNQIRTLAEADVT